MTVATDLALNLLEAMKSGHPLPKTLFPNQQALKVLCEALVKPMDFASFTCDSCPKLVMVEHVTCGECTARTKFDPVGDVVAFAEKFEITYEGKPRVLPPDLSDFRIKFLKEEIREYAKATYQGEYAAEMGSTMDPDHSAADLVGKLCEMLDAMQDTIYVAIGTMLLHGFTPEIIRESWRRIHEANMAKVRAPSAEASKRGHTMDVVKPPGWEAPTHRDLVADHAHRLQRCCVEGCNRSTHVNESLFCSEHAKDDELVQGASEL